MAIRRMTILEHTQAHISHYLNCACIGIGSGYVIAILFHKFNWLHLVLALINLAVGIGLYRRGRDYAREQIAHFYEGQMTAERDRVRFAAKDRL